MSIEKLTRASGTAWRVRWRDEHGQPRAKVVGLKRDAQILDQELKRAKRLGTAALPAPAARPSLSSRRFGGPGTPRRTSRATRARVTPQRLTSTSSRGWAPPA
jgi:hypothetical protein